MTKKRPQKAADGSRAKATHASGKPIGHCTALERQARIVFAMDLLASGNHPGEHIKALKEKFNIEWRQARRYLALASREFAKKMNDDADKKARRIGRRVHFLENLLYNDLKTDRNRLTAEERLARIYGDDPPLKHEVHTPDIRAEDVIAAMPKAAKEQGDGQPLGVGEGTGQSTNGRV